MHEPDPEKAALALVKRYLIHQGYEVVDVSHTRGHNGYDLLARREREEQKIEVKGCTRPWGIPDPYFTEFDADRRLVADFLYVVYFLEAENAPKLCVIPRAAIDPSMVQLRQGYRISSSFKKASVMDKYVMPFDETADSERP